MRNVLFGSIFTLAFLGAAQSAAQDNNQVQVIEEITVTGTKQNTSLQDADVAVTVLNEQALFDARVADIGRIDDLVPNVQFNDASPIGGVFISIRGVESNPFIVNRAAVYIDGIPFRELSNSVLTQLQSVEVLRGPQSTLYGANTESGLVVINTRPPSDEFTANASFTQADFETGDSSEIDGFLGGPLIENQLSGSLSFQYGDRDYYLQNTGATPQGQAQIEEFFTQGRLRWTPTDRLTVNFLAYVIDTEAPGLYSFDGFPVEIDRYNAIYSDGILFDSANPFSPAPFNGSQRAADFRFVHDAPKRVEVEQVIIGLNANYVIDPGNIDFAISYRSEDTDDRGFDIDGTNAPLLAGAETEEEEVFNSELRFMSDTTRALRYTVGASYYYEEDIRALGSLTGPGGLNDFVFAPDQSLISSDISVFGSLSYSPPSNSNLTATFGLRYDNARRETTQESGELDLGFSVFFFSDLELEETFEAVLPRFALTHESSDTLTFYASAAKGYLPGGFNLTAADAGVDIESLKYNSEELWSYEVGARWQSRDGRGRLARAVFYIEADNYQEITVLLDEKGNVLTTSLITSDAEIESYGFEIEGQWDITDTFMLTGNFGFTDAEYTDFARLEATEVIGNPVKLIPEYDVNIAARYQHPSGFFVRGEINSIGETALDEGNRTGFTANALDIQEAVEIYGVQAGYESENWSIRVFGENLSDERRINGSGFPNAVLPADGLLNASIDTPRTIGLELTVRY